MNNAERNFLPETRNYELAARDKATMKLNRDTADTAAVSSLHKKWHYTLCQRQERINSHQRQENEPAAKNKKAIFSV